MEQKILKSKEICDIIRQCSESGVSSLKFGDLEISFEDKKNISELATFQGHETEINNIEVEPVKLENFIDESQVNEDARELRVMQINESLLEDPHLAETILSSEELLEDYIDSYAREGNVNAET